jgi:maltooligosyltrehalose synthase
MPLEATGARSAHVVALARVLGDAALVALTPRLVASLGDWDDTTVRLPAALAERSFVHLFTGQSLRPKPSRGAFEISVAEALRDCPVAILLAR